MGASDHHRVVVFDDGSATASVLRAAADASDTSLTITCASSLPTLIQALEGGAIDCVVAPTFVAAPGEADPLADMASRFPGVAFVTVGGSDLDRSGDQLELEGLNSNQIRMLLRYALERDRTIARADAAEQRTRAVFDSLHEGVLIQDSHGNVLDANRMASQILAIPLDELVTDPPRPMPWHADRPDGTPLATDQFPGRRAIREGTPQIGAVLLVPLPSGPRWIDVNSVPVTVPGEPAGLVVSSFRDVTERIAAEEQISFQGRLLESAGPAITAVDVEGRVIFWNSQAEQLFGWSRDEAMGRFGGDLIRVPQLLEQGQALMATLLDGQNWSGDFWLKRRDGAVIPVLLSCTPMFDDAKRVVAISSVTIDITDRKQAAARSAQLSAIVASSTDAILSSTNGVVDSWNAGAERLLGYTAEEAIGQPVQLIVPPELADEARGLNARAMSGVAVDAFETVRLARDGTRIDVSLSLSPIFDENSDVAGVSAIARDTRPRLALERAAERSREQQRAAEHAAAVQAIERDAAQRSNEVKSRFLSHVSHELRTPLNAIIGFTQLLDLGREDLGARHQRAVDEIRRAGDHLLALVNDILDIGAIEAEQIKIEPEVVDVRATVSQAASLVARSAEERGIDVEIEIDGAPTAFADQRRTLQILVNLMSNAVKYNRDGGSVRVRSSRPRSGYVRVTVADDGHGIDPDHLDSIFDAFERGGVTTRVEIEGTGLGLAVSRKLVGLMGGELGVESTPGVGSAFWLDLPVGQPTGPA